MKVLVTGSDGFIGKNLRAHLAERKDVEVVEFTRKNAHQELDGMLVGVDLVFHLAGVNRPQDPQEFDSGNAGLTQALCSAIESCGRRIAVVYTSSIQAEQQNAYAVSKRAAERALFALGRRTGTTVHVFRLPNVFGKWAKPNYNSAVATFCFQIGRGQPIRVDDPAAVLTLAYVDDVVERFIQLMDGADANADAEGFERVPLRYTTTVGEVAHKIKAFGSSRSTLLTERVGTGLERALYATFLSYLPDTSFSYPLAEHRDARGVFVEMLKTPDCGQFSFFTARPGVTRGGHYHHTKSEKFLVLKGSARFRFRALLTGQSHELHTSGGKAEIVETIPGWTHDITNVGDDEMIVLLWANEIFDRSKPDTYACPF